MSDYVHQTTDQNIYSSFVHKVQKKMETTNVHQQKNEIFYERSYNEILHNKEKE